MKANSKFLIGALLFAISTSSINASADGLPGEQFVINGPESGEPSLGVVIEDSQFIKNNFSSLQAFDSKDHKNDDVPTSFKDCPVVGGKGCEANLFFNFKAFFSSCDAGKTSDCVTEVAATTPDGVKHIGKYVEEFPGNTDYSYEGNPSLNLPDGGSAFIVDFPDVPHSKGSLYLVTVNVAGQKYFDQTKFNVQDFSAGIFAVTLVNGKYYPAQPNHELSHFDRVGAWTYMRIARQDGSQGYSTCVQATFTRCAIAWPLPTDVTFALKMKLHTKVAGWLHGRLADVTADVTQASDGDQIVTVAGKPIIVPAVYQWFKKTEIPAAVAKYYETDPRYWIEGTGFSNEKGSSMLKDSIQYSDFDFPEVLAWYTALADKASSAATAWSFRSIQRQMAGTNCVNSDSKLTGIVTTNSNMYVAQPPDFNRENQSLDYKVASPHYLPDGTVFKGTYNLVMRSDFARCIYGFTSAPVSASVSVISADGSSQVATTVLGERNDWLYLSANNFTFSSPTLRIKLSQQKADSQTINKFNPAVIKKTISCKKGKSVKIVVAVKPVCPAGYKKS